MSTSTFKLLFLRLVFITAGLQVTFDLNAANVSGKEEVKISENVQAMFDNGDYHKVISLSEKKLASLSKNQQKERLPYLHIIGNSYLKLGFYNEAVDYFAKGQDLSERLNDQKWKANFINSTGVYHFELKQFDEAEYYYIKAKNIRKKINDKVGLINSYNNIGVISKVKKEPVEALKYYEMSLELVEGIYGKTGKSYIIALNNTANASRDLKKYDVALNNLMKGLELSKKEGLRYHESLCLINMASVYYELEEWENAESVLLQSQRIAEELETPKLILATLRSLSELYKAQGDFEKAMDYLSQNYAVLDKQSRIRSEGRYSFLEARLESLRKDKEIELLENESAQKDFKRQVLWGGIALMFIIGLIIFYGQRKLIRKEKLLVEFEKKEVEELEGELEGNKKELTNYALHLAQRNDFLRKLKKELSRMGRAVSDDKNSDKLNDLSIQIHKYVAYNKEEENFNRKLEEVNHKFFTNLARACKDLTENEKKLCALLRLKLSSKDIASVNNISSKSVDMNRYRLRKKLNLHSGEDLYEYLSQF